MNKQAATVCWMAVFLFLAGCVSPAPTSIKPRALLPTETAQKIAQPTDTIPRDAVSGIVMDEGGKPVENATVRLQATSLSTTTNSRGQFILTGIKNTAPFKLTAFSPGHFIKEATAIVGTAGIKITLVAHTSVDHPEYSFLPAGSGKDGSGCAQCHSADAAEAARGVTLPFDQWSLDAHSKSALNPRFLSMYNGTDLQGHQSPPTTYITQKDYGQIPLPPTLDASYFGPGFKLDFPQQTGNCAACHAPVAAINAAYDADPNLASGTALEGVTCDFCHKIWGMTLAPGSRMPNDNMPGVLSYEFRRPSTEHNLFIGPFDDVAPGEDTLSPLQNQSDYCAPCHSANFWNTKVYNSYGEWLESPYSNSNSQQYRTCQDCHMPPIGMDHFVRIDKGANIRLATTIFSHRMPGASDEKLLQNTATLDVAVKREAGLINVSVSVFNANAGHDMPTDSPLRQILLSVKAVDQTGQPLAMSDGPVLPKWTGDYQNTPGIYFAKILEELWTEVSPTASYWMQTRILEDTRLHALDTKKTVFVFKSPQESGGKVSVSLIYRRAYSDIMQQKGWNTPDIIMNQKIFQLP